MAERTGISPGTSARFRAVIDLAYAAARQRHAPMDDRHLLVGLLAEGGSDAARLLGERGRSVDAVRAGLVDGDVPPDAHTPFSDHAKQIVRRAQTEAARRSATVTPEHLLLALVDDGDAAALLGPAPEVATLRAELIRLIDGA